MRIYFALLPHIYKYKYNKGLQKFFNSFFDDNHTSNRGGRRQLDGT
jgi:hypothetical protein